jgi:hypothetical protein
MILFTDGQFPYDFSLVLAVRPLPVGSRSMLFTVYSETADEQLSLSLGNTVELFYRDSEGFPSENYKAFVKFNYTVNDGK